MRWFARFLLPLSITATSLQSAPSSIVGNWRIGHPFVDMKPQPIGLNSKQEKMLIGQVLTISSASVRVCGKSFPIESLEVEQYSPESFLQRYAIRPDQIGLNSPITELSFKFPPPRTVCGNSEGFVLLTDGHHAAFEDGNDYFRLSKVESPLS